MARGGSSQDRRRDRRAAERRAALGLNEAPGSTPSVTIPPADLEALDALAASALELPPPTLAAAETVSVTLEVPVDAGELTEEDYANMGRFVREVADDQAFEGQLGARVAAGELTVDEAAALGLQRTEDLMVAAALEEGAAAGVAISEGAARMYVRASRAAGQPIAPAQVAEFATALAMSGECANCGHMATAHLGPGNDGPCSATVDGDTCSCTGMKEMAAEAAVEAAEFAIGEGEGQARFRLIFPPEASEAAADALLRSAELVRVNGDGSPFAADEAQQLDSEGPGIADALRERFARFMLEFEADPSLPAEHQPGTTLPPPNPSAVAPAVAPLGGPNDWNAIFIPEATLTDDGRAMAPGSISWRELPLTLMGMNETGPGGHEGAVACGRIDRIWRDGDLVRASGVFSADETGQYFATNVADGTIRGVSVDLAIHEYEVGPKSDYFDEAGHWIREAALADEAEAEEPSLLDILFGEEAEDSIFVVTKAVIGMSTVCPFPAFAGAKIELGNSLVAGANPGIVTVTSQAGFVVTVGARIGEPIPGGPGEGIKVPLGETGILTVTAAAAGLAPVAPPADWFRNPELEELTPLTVDDDGRIYGHAWAWDTCHMGISGVCVTAPHSNTNYAYFHLGEIVCSEGERIPVGRITFGTGHADRRLGRLDTTAHYDDSGTVGAFVIVGEDEHGGWVAGAVRADITAEEAQMIRGCTPSGDWRDVDGNLELVALLEVNVPGFPVPRRPQALVASSENGDRVLSLIAAGIHAGPATPRLTAEERAKIDALADIAEGRFAALAALAEA